MSKLTTAAELYEAARETCVRLFVANGGDKDALWTVEPYPGTAAISVENIWEYRARKTTRVQHWRLHMPAYPVDARLPRWHATLIAAYSVHELLHALYTNFDVTKRASLLGVMRLLNALEDVRIEKKAQKSLQRTPEARRLLDALTTHIVDRAVRSKIDWSDPRQFSFFLNCVLMREICGYALPSFPADWRKRAGPMLPLIEMALQRLPRCKDTEATLALALDIQGASRSIKIPPQPQPGQGQPQPQPGQDEGDENEGAGQSEDLFSQESEDDASEPQGTPQTAVKPEGDEDSDQDEKGAGKPAQGAGEGDEGKDDKDVDVDEGNEDDEGDVTGEGEGEDAGSENEGKSKGEGDGEDADSEASDSKEGKASGPGGDSVPDEGQAPDLSDGEQSYSEANLNDLAEQIARQENRSLPAIETENKNAAEFFAAVPSIERDMLPNVDAPDRVASIIQTPARLRRHIINAVKAPERSAVNRRQGAGRFDTRMLPQALAGATSVYRRREDEEARNVAVSLLVDGSSSMDWEGWNAQGQRNPSRMHAAACLALHVGDALKIAAVPFEIMGFHCATPLHNQNRARVDVSKAFNQPWNEAARNRTAALASYADGGTFLMLAMKTAVARLARRTNATRRILLTLTDGMDAFHYQNIVALRAWALSKGVEVFGVAIQVDEYERPPFDGAFGDDKVYVTDIRQLSTDGFAALQTLLTRPVKTRRQVA